MTQTTPATPLPEASEGHTPSEWFWAFDRHNQPIALMRSGSGDYIATPQVDISDYGLSVNCYIDVSDKDADLIRAAPCLLKALVGLVDMDLTYNGSSVVIPADSHSDAIERVRTARAAILRATGASK